MGGDGVARSAWRTLPRAALLGQAVAVLGAGWVAVDTGPPGVGAALLVCSSAAMAGRLKEASP